MHLPINNIHEDLHILTKQLDKLGAICLTRSALGLTEYCFMTHDKIHFIIPIKVDDYECYPVAYPRSGFTLKASAIYETLLNIPESLEACDYEAVCVIQYTGDEDYYAYTPQDFINTTTRPFQTPTQIVRYGTLYKIDGRRWDPADILREMFKEFSS